MTKTTSVRGRGRPRKTPSAIDLAQQEHPSVVKRGRGRPRKHPPKPNPPATDLGKDQPKLGQAPLDLLEFLKAPGMASTWGSVKKGKRVHVRRGRRGGEWGKENGGYLGSPSSREFDCSSSTESNSILKPEDSWPSDFEILGPIPDLDAVFWDQCILGRKDFFSDLPDDCDFPLD